MAYMSKYVAPTIEIDFKDILLYLLKKAYIVLVVALIGGFLGAQYVYMKGVLPSASEVLDISSKLDGESEADYRNRVANVEHAVELMNTISARKKYVDVQNDYVNNSLFMQINPLETYSSQAQLVVGCNDESDGALDALVAAYEADIEYGDYLLSVADVCGYDANSLRELITFNSILSSSDLVNNADVSVYLINTVPSASTVTIEVSVIGPSTEITDMVLDCVLDEMEEYSALLNESIVSHSLSLVGRQSLVNYSELVRDRQLETIAMIDDLELQITANEKKLDEVAKELGFPNRLSLYNTDSNTLGVSTFLKYAVLGFIIGTFGACLLFVLYYLFGKRILSQAQFWGYFNDVDNIGVCKPLNKRTKLQSLIDGLSGDDNRLSLETANSLIVANYTNLTRSKERVLITGTTDSEYVRNMVKKLGIKDDAQFDMFNNPSILKNASSYDGVVLIEQRGVSKKKDVRTEIRLLHNSGANLIGAIIV